MPRPPSSSWNSSSNKYEYDCPSSLNTLSPCPIEYEYTSPYEYENDCPSTNTLSSSMNEYEYTSPNENDCEKLVSVQMDSTNSSKLDEQLDAVPPHWSSRK